MCVTGRVHFPLLPEEGLGEEGPASKLSPPQTVVFNFSGRGWNLPAVSRRGFPAWSVEGCLVLVLVLVLGSFDYDYEYEYEYERWGDSLSSLSNCQSS